MLKFPTLTPRVIEPGHGIRVARHHQSSLSIQIDRCERALTADARNFTCWNLYFLNFFLVLFSNYSLGNICKENLKAYLTFLNIEQKWNGTKQTPFFLNFYFGHLEAIDGCKKILKIKIFETHPTRDPTRWCCYPSWRRGCGRGSKCTTGLTRLRQNVQTKWPLGPEIRIFIRF